MIVTAVVGIVPHEFQLIAAAATVGVALAYLIRRRLLDSRASTVQMENATVVSLEDIAKYPGGAGLGMADAPTKVEFAPSNDQITYLASAPGALAQTLFALDIKSGKVKELVASNADEASYSAEEKLRRERLRLLHTGVTDYSWAPTTSLMLIPQGGRSLAIIETPGAAPQPLFDERTQQGDLPAGEAPIIDATLSQDGKVCCFVCDREVYACATNGKGGGPVQLTHGARGTERSNGVANFIAQEEMDRMEGYWISPPASDGSLLLAFEQCDESAIPLFTIPHHVDDSQAQETHRYPFAGAENPKVRIGVVPIRLTQTATALQATAVQAVASFLTLSPTSRAPSTPVIWLELGANTSEEIYVARVAWRDAHHLLVQTQDRRQTELRLLLVDARTGQSSVLLVERAATWVNLHRALVPLRDGGFVWASERTGFRHLAVHNADGSLRRALTSGEWVVDHTDKSMVDEARGRLFLLGNQGDARQRHLFVLSLQNGSLFVKNGLKQLTRDAGMHSVSLSRDFEHFIDTFSTARTPLEVRICETADGAVLRTIFTSKDPELGRLRPHLEPPTFVSIPSADGAVTLHAALYKPPPETFGPGPYPLVVSVYGGPHVQRVCDSWALTADLRSQHLRLKGYLVLKLDNRGSDRRGHAFEAALHKRMGSIELEDQKAGVEWCIEQGLAVPSRVAIMGWSYGGYMSAMALAKHPKTFHVGIAGAPVTSWDGYDTHYTERYMGLPQENVEGYRESSVMTHVDHIEGKLMLIQGLLDENVHFRHVARLATALIRSRKEYDLLAFPDERHLPRSVPDRVYMEQRVMSFLARNL